MAAPPRELESSLNKLSLDPYTQKASPSNNKKHTVADSWEDEDLSSGEETDRPLSPQQSADYPAAPPPTPISPTTTFAGRDRFISPYQTDPWSQSSNINEISRSGRTNARPEKTDAVAKRLIAGALGVRAPKKTEEQRAYDRAMEGKEIKRKAQEKEAAGRAKEEAERAKVAMWSD